MDTVFNETVEVLVGHDMLVEEQIWRAVAARKLSKRKAKHIRRLLAKLRDECILASEQGESIEVFIKRVTRRR